MYVTEREKVILYVSFQRACAFKRSFIRSSPP